MSTSIMNNKPIPLDTDVQGLEIITINITNTLVSKSNTLVSKRAKAFLWSEITSEQEQNKAKKQRQFCQGADLPIEPCPNSNN